MANDSKNPEVASVPYNPVRFLLTIAVIALLILIASLIPGLKTLHGIINWFLIALILILGRIIGDRIYYLIT